MSAIKMQKGSCVLSKNNSRITVLEDITIPIEKNLKVETDIGSLIIQVPNCPKNIELPEKREVTALTFSHDGKLLAVATRDKNICIWDINIKQIIMTFTDVKEYVFKLRFSTC